LRRAYKTEILQEDKILAGFNSFSRRACRRFRRTGLAAADGGDSGHLAAEIQKTDENGPFWRKKAKK
jgi:hypothetical protein